MRSAEQHGLAVERLAPAEAQRRFPGLALPAGLEAVFEPAAGYLLVEDCVRAHLQAACDMGAWQLANQRVVHWSVEGHSVRVVTEGGEFSAARLVVCGGAWASQLLASLQLPLRVVRKHLYWFANTDERYRADRGCPAFLYELADGCFYGFPQIDWRGVKVAEHSGGTPVTDPSQLDQSLEPLDKARVTSFVAGHLLGVTRETRERQVCMYTLTPDEHFVVDRHPEHESVVFAAGLSGHGFKFSPVLGEVLVDLALEGETAQPIGLLSARRFT
jgi:monomeric sarcosine oxidase